MIGGSLTVVFQLFRKFLVVNIKKNIEHETFMLIVKTMQVFFCKPYDSSEA